MILSLALSKGVLLPPMDPPQKSRNNSPYLCVTAPPAFASQRDRLAQKLASESFSLAAS